MTNVWAGYGEATMIAEEPNLSSKGAVTTPRPEGAKERSRWKGRVV